jgi:hypothetical protein
MAVKKNEPLIDSQLNIDALANAIVEAANLVASNHRLSSASKGILNKDAGQVVKEFERLAAAMAVHTNK